VVVLVKGWEAEFRDKCRIDGLDRKILRLLRGDGRTAYRDLGAAVGLSAKAAADRSDG
jgi:DNA-binding Lrp family transcriptional regulator